MGDDALRRVFLFGSAMSVLNLGTNLQNYHNKA